MPSRVASRVPWRRHERTGSDQGLEEHREFGRHARTGYTDRPAATPRTPRMWRARTARQRAAVTARVSPAATALVQAGLLAKLGATQRQRADVNETLYQFVPRVSRRFQAPYHLRPILSLLDEALTTGGVEACSSTPPRHTKTSSIVHWIVKKVCVRPHTYIGYGTYNQDRADSESGKARIIANAAGVEFRRDTMREWQLANGSKIIWGGVGGAWTGEGFHVVIIDDPFKNREEAESPLIREKVWEWFNDVIYTRQEPGKMATSFIVNHTRWHTDDLIGRLTKQGWRSVNLPAISDDGDALWPEGFDIDRLRKAEAQLGPYAFASLYQGRPIAKGAEVFGEPTYFDSLPVGVGYRCAIGNDFAYTVRTWSDFSVGVALRRYVTGVSYVVEVVRERCELPAFRKKLREMADRHPGAQILGFVSGTEKGGLQFFGEGDPKERVCVEPLNAVGDKFQRAQAVAAAWNSGDVQIPRSLLALGECGAHLRATDEGMAPWLPAFLDEVRSFTGVKDAHDDQVDALAGAFEPFRTMLPSGSDHDRRPQALDADRSQRWGNDGRGFG